MRELTAEGDPTVAGSILGEVGQAVATVSPGDGRLLWANDACERLFGYGAGTLAGRHLSDISAAPVHSPGARAASIAREIARAGVWSGDTEGVRADGSTFGCVASISELAEGEAGRVWIAVFLRTSQSLAADPRPVATRQVTELVFEGASAPMAVVGTDLRVAEGNRALLELTGRPYHEVVGQGFAGVLHPDEARPVLDRLHAVLEGDADIVRGDTRLAAADRRGLPVSLTIALVRDLDRRPLYALLILEPIPAPP
jgi:PAS domain S-box-containing protein